MIAWMLPRPALLAPLAALLLAGQVEAQASVALNRYRGAPRPQDGFALSGGDVGPHLGYAVSLRLDYADDPLVYEDVVGESDTELIALVDHQVTSNLALSLGLYDTALLYAGLPVHLAMDGERLGDQPAATGFGAGDLYFGGRLRVHRSKPAQVALELTMTVPTGEDGAGGRPGVAGDGSATFGPQVNAELHGGPVTVLVNVGARFREDVKLGRERFSDVLSFGAGASLPIVPELHVLAELYGESPMDDLGDRTASPLEALAGLRLSAPPGFTFGLGLGMGLLRGYGSPDLRVVGMLAYHQPAQPASAEPPREAEPIEIAAPAVVEPPPTSVPAMVADADVDDRDRDGVPDLDDRCPVAPGASAEGGCPRFLRYDPATGQIELLQAIRFEGASAKLKPDAEAVLAEVAALFSANPELKLWIEAHLTSAGRTKAALAMPRSVERAATLTQWLQTHGIDRKRIEALGCGSNRPLVPDRGAQRFKNERIELHVSYPLPPTGIRSSIGCEHVSAPEAPAKAPPPAALPEPPPKPAPAPRAAAAPVPPPAPAPSKPAPAPTATAPVAPPKPVPAPPPSPPPAAPIVAPVVVAPPATAAAAAAPIELSKPIRFEEGTATLADRSGAALDELAAALRESPAPRVTIVAHVAEEAGAQASLELTKQRAAAVRKALASRGIAPARMSAYGCGEARPIAPNNVPWGRKKNDRVEVLTLDPASPSGVQSLNGCGASN
jgi:outer membrane protein OmpA-like peptidoglycan-associated protein